MLPTYPCIVRCTPHRTGVLLLALAGSLSALSFAGGFAASHYWIDRDLVHSTQVLNRAAQAYEAEQTLVFREWSEQYAQLARRIAAIPQGREVAHVRR
jgi:coproporphyrinogen III oxidase